MREKRIVSHFQIPLVCIGMFAVNKTARDCTHNKYTQQVLLYTFATVNKACLVSFKRSARFNQTDDDDEDDCALQRKKKGQRHSTEAIE